MEPLEITLTASDNSTHTACCRTILREIAGRRTVFDGTFDGCPAIIKRFEDWFGWYRCRREKRGLERLAGRGLSAPKVLMAGIDEKGQHVLAIEKIEDAADGASAVETADSEDAAKATLVLVFQYIARMHEAGVVQNDLHLGNFLIAGSSVSAIDPAWMRYRSQSIPQRESFEQLAIVLASLPEEYLVWHSEFLCAYSEIRGWTYNSDMLDSVRQLALCRRKKRLPHQLRKTLRNSRDFFVLEQPPYRAVFYKKGIDADSAGDMIHRLESMTAADDPSLNLDLKGRIFEVQQFSPKNRLFGLWYGLTGSPVRRAWLAAWKARYTGQTQLYPAAFIEFYRGEMFNRGWLVKGGMPAK